jgi:hypothetical protein
MVAAQINNQLMPRGLRVGVGASFVTLQPGDSFQMTLDVSQGGNPSLAIPADLNASGFGVNFTGKYTGTTPYQLFPGQFSYVEPLPFGSATYTYKVLSASATAPPPAHVVWYGPPAATPGATPAPVLHQIPISGGTTGASMYPLVSGHRTRVTIVASGAPLPAIYGSPTAPLTLPTIQANLNGSGSLLDLGTGQFQVANVNYVDASTLQVDFDYCGATKNIAAGGSFSVSGSGGAPVPVTVSFTDQGPSPAGACAAMATTTSSKTPYYVAGGAAVVLAGGAAWWAWGRKKGRR